MEVTLSFGFDGEAIYGHRLIAPGDDSYLHIQYFAEQMYITTAFITILSPEVNKYMGPQKIRYIIDADASKT